MKKFFDKLFDAALSLFTFIALLASLVLIVSAVVFTVMKGEAHTGIVVSAIISASAAVSAGYFLFKLYEWRK